MALYLNDPEFLETLWEAAPKMKDGRVHYTLKEIESLWDEGFIDTGKYSLPQWIKIAETYKKSATIYALDYDEFMSLDAYRYKGEIRVPFDPDQIHEGMYSEKEFDELFETSVTPSCNLSAEDLNKFSGKLKQDFRDPDGAIRVDRIIKSRIKILLENNPSPIRRLELTLDYVFELAENYLKEEGIDIQKIAAAAQQSMFTSKATSTAERKSQMLKDITKARKKEAKTPEKKTKGVKLSQLKRSKKGTKS